MWVRVGDGVEFYEAVRQQFYSIRFVEKIHQIFIEIKLLYKLFVTKKAQRTLHSSIHEYMRSLD